MLPYAGGHGKFWTAAAHPVTAEQLRGLLAAADQQPGVIAGRLPESGLPDSF